VLPSLRKSRMRGQPRGWRFFLKKMRLVGQNAAFLKKSVFYLYPNCANKILVRLLYILRHTLKRVCRIRTNDRARVFYFSSETRLKTRSYFNPYVVSPGQVFFFNLSERSAFNPPPEKPFILSPCTDLHRPNHEFNLYHTPIFGGVRSS